MSLRVGIRVASDLSNKKITHYKNGIYIQNKSNVRYYTKMVKALA